MGYIIVLKKICTIYKKNVYVLKHLVTNLNLRAIINIKVNTNIYPFLGQKNRVELKLRLILQQA